MSIHREDDYWVDRDLEGRLSLGIESGRLEACIAQARDRRVEGVFGSPSFNFREDNLDFLASLTALKKIWFWDVTLRDVGGIYALAQLQDFGVHPVRPGIDFSRLATLEEVVWVYNVQDTGLASLRQLSLLHLWHYNPKLRTFEGLDLPASLVEMQINWANPRSLIGIPQLIHLKRLEIHRCRNLETLRELPRIAPNLEHLVVAACGRVADGDEIVRLLPKLQHAFVRDTLLVRDGEIVRDRPQS